MTKIMAWFGNIIIVVSLVLIQCATLHHVLGFAASDLRHHPASQIVAADLTGGERRPVDHADHTDHSDHTDYDRPHCDMDCQKWLSGRSSADMLRTILVQGPDHDPVSIEVKQSQLQLTNFARTVHPPGTVRIGSLDRLYARTGRLRL